MTAGMGDGNPRIPVSEELHRELQRQKLLRDADTYDDVLRDVLFGDGDENTDSLFEL